MVVIQLRHTMRRAFIAAARVVAGKLRHYDAGRGVLRMDELVVADVDADVADIAAAGIEAEDIAGLKVAHGNAVVGLIAGNTVERVAELAIHIVNKAGAVKAAARRGAAPAVIVADELERVVRDLPSKLTAVTGMMISE